MLARASLQPSAAASLLAAVSRQFAKAAMDHGPSAAEASSDQAAPAAVLHQDLLSRSVRRTSRPSSRGVELPRRAYLRRSARAELPMSCTLSKAVYHSAPSQPYGSEGKCAVPCH